MPVHDHHRRNDARDTLGRLNRARGLTSVEIAMVLLIASLTLGLGAVVSRTAVTRADGAANVREMAALVSQAQRFAIANNRLPCPDRTGDGLENCASPPDPRLGGFPHRSLGLGAAVTDARGEPVFYAASPDLQAPPFVAVASWDYPSGALDRFCLALKDRLSAGFRADELAISPLGSAGCSESGGAFNPALVFVSAGTMDSDGSSDRFDGLNVSAVRSGGLCVENPGRPVSSNYDDQVRAVGLSELNGLLCLKGRDVFNATLNASVAPP